METTTIRIDIQGAKEEAAKLNTVEAKIKQLNFTRNTMNKLVSQGVQLTKEQNQILTKTTVELSAEKQKRAELSTSIKNNSKFRLAEKGSIAQMRAELNLVSVAWAKETKLMGANSQHSKNLKARKTELTNAIKAEEMATGDARRNVGNYGASVQQALGSMGGYGSMMSGNIMKLQAMTTATVALTGATGAGSKAMKVLKIAMLGTGVGALIVLIGSLVAYFSRTEEGVNKLKNILAPFQILLGNIGDVAGNIGETIVAAFENPKESITALWKLIQSQIVNRFTGLLGQFKAVGKVLQGVFELDFDMIKEGAAEYGDQTIQMLTGVENFAGKVKGTFAGITDFVKETADETKKLQDINNRQLALDKRSRAFKTEEKNLVADIAEARVKVYDASLSAIEKEKVILDAIDKQHELDKMRLSIKQEDLDLAEERAALSDSDADTLDDIADKEAALADVRVSSASTMRFLISQRNAAAKAITKEQEAQLALQEKAIELEEQRLINFQERLLKEQEQTEKDIDEDAKAVEDEDLDLNLDVEEEEDPLIEKERLKWQAIEDIATKGVTGTTRKILGSYRAMYAAVEAARRQDTLNEEQAAAAKQKIKKAEVTTAMQGAYMVASFAADNLEQGTIAQKVAAIAAAGIQAGLAIIQAMNNPTPMNIIMPVLIGAAAAIQIAKIANTKPPKIDKPKTPRKLEKGGWLRGMSHLLGGIPMSVNGVPGYEGEDGEFVVNKQAAAKHGSLLESINNEGSRVPSATGQLANGGTIIQPDVSNIGDQIVQTLGSLKVVNDPVETLREGSNTMTVENSDVI